MIYILKQNDEKGFVEDADINVFAQILKYYKLEGETEDCTTFKRDVACPYANIWKGGRQTSTFLPYKLIIKYVGWDEMAIENIIKKHHDKRRAIQKPTK